MFIETKKIKELNTKLNKTAQKTNTRQTADST